MKTLTTGFLALALAATALTGCSTDSSPITSTTTDEPVAPVVPPQAAFAFDFGLFDTPESRAYAETGELSREADSVTHLNWLNAAIRVLYLDAILTKALTPPATVLAIALNQAPTYQGQGTWLFAFDYTDNAGVEVSVRLYATVDTVGEIVTWEMVVSSNEHDPVLVDFLWFEGETSLVSDAGYFLFHETDGRDAARMTYELDVAERSLLFEALDVESEDVGDFVRYSVDGDDVEVRVHDDSEGIDTVMEWSETTHAGSITAPDYNEGERACWDEQLLDVVCEVEAS